MDSRTQAEVDMINSEYSVRIPEKAIIEFLDDYDERGNVVHYLLILNELYNKNSVETLIDCVYQAFYNYKRCFELAKENNRMTIEEIKEYLRKRMEEQKND